MIARKPSCVDICKAINKVEWIIKKLKENFRSIVLWSLLLWSIYKKLQIQRVYFSNMRIHEKESKIQIQKIILCNIFWSSPPWIFRAKIKLKKKKLMSISFILFPETLFKLTLFRTVLGIITIELKWSIIRGYSERERVS